MKQNNGSSKPVTIGELKIEIGNLEQRLSKKFATKTDLHNLEKSLRDELLRLEKKMERMEERVDENARKYRDELLAKLDEVMGELQTRREESTIGTYQTREIREQVGNHEKRIARLEKTKQTS